MKTCVLFMSLSFFCFQIALAEDMYTFGVVPQFEPEKLTQIWRPILKEITQETGIKFKLIGSPKIPAFEKSFMDGDFDFAYMNPYHALNAAKHQGYVTLVRDGGRKLCGVIVVRKDSLIKSVKDLERKSIAFPAPNALGASLIVRSDLENLHKIKFSPIYVQTHSSVYLHVVTGVTEAGGGVISTLQQQKIEVQDRLRLIYKTRSMSPHPVTAHPRVPKNVMEKVKRAFLKLGKTNPELLSKVPMRKIIAAHQDDYSEIEQWELSKFYIKK